MSIIIVNKIKFVVINFRGKTIWILGGSGGDWGAEGGVVVVNNVSLSIHEIGDVFVAVVEVVGERGGGGKEDQWARGDRFRGVPDIGVEEGVVGTTKLLDTKIVVVDKALEGFFAILHRAHFDTSAHAVKGHSNQVFGIVGDRPNAGLGLDEGLISVCVVLGREVVNRGVLVEVVGRVGLAFVGGTISDVIVGIGNIVCGNELVSDVVTILLVILRGAAAKRTRRSP